MARSVCQVTWQRGRGLLGAQVVPRAASSGVLCSLLVAGRMLGWSRLTFILLSGIVTCLVAQQVPPVGELEPRRLRGARRSGGGGGAQGRGRRGLIDPWQHLYRHPCFSKQRRGCRTGWRASPLVDSVQAGAKKL